MSIGQADHSNQAVVHLRGDDLVRRLGVLVLWAVTFAGIPLHAAVSVQLNRIDRTSNIKMISHGQFDQSDRVSNVPVLRRGFVIKVRAPRPYLIEGSLTCRSKKLDWSIHSADEAKIAQGAAINGKTPPANFTWSRKRISQYNFGFKKFQTSVITTFSHKRYCDDAIGIGSVNHSLIINAEQVGPSFGYRCCPLTRKFSQMTTGRRILPSHIFEDTSSFSRVIPTFWQKRDSAETEIAGRDEEYLSVKCAHFAVVIPLRTGNTNAAITSKNQFLVSEIDHPKGPMLDLGQCRASEAEPDHKESFHLLLRSYDTSSVTEFDGKPLIAGVTVFVTWDEKQWYRVVRLQTKASRGGVTGRGYCLTETNTRISFGLYADVEGSARACASKPRLFKKSRSVMAAVGNSWALFTNMTTPRASDGVSPIVPRPDAGSPVGINFIRTKTSRRSSLKSNDSFVPLDDTSMKDTRNIGPAESLPINSTFCASVRRRGACCCCILRSSCCNLNWSAFEDSAIARASAARASASEARVLEAAILLSKLLANNLADSALRSAPDKSASAFSASITAPPSRMSLNVCRVPSALETRPSDSPSPATPTRTRTHPTRPTFFIQGGALDSSLMVLISCTTSGPSSKTPSATRTDDMMSQKKYESLADWKSSRIDSSSPRIISGSTLIDQDLASDERRTRIVVYSFTVLGAAFALFVILIAYAWYATL